MPSALPTSPPTAAHADPVANGGPGSPRALQDQTRRITGVLESQFQWILRRVGDADLSRSDLGAPFNELVARYRQQHQDLLKLQGGAGEHSGAVDNLSVTWQQAAACASERAALVEQAEQRIADARHDCSVAAARVRAVEEDISAMQDAVTAEQQRGTLRYHRLKQCSERIDKADAAAASAGKEVAQVLDSIKVCEAKEQEVLLQIRLLQRRLRDTEQRADDEARAIADCTAEERVVVRDGQRAARSLEVAKLSWQAERSAWVAERETMRYEIASLSKSLEDRTSVLQPYEELRAKVRDSAELLGRLEEKEAAIDRCKAMIAEQQALESSRQSAASEAGRKLLARVSDAGLGGAITSLEAAAKSRWHHATTLVGQCSLALPPEVDPSKTIASVYPDPCHVGDELSLVVTVCDSSQTPVSGITAEELCVRTLEQPELGQIELGSKLLPAAVGEPAGEEAVSPSRRRWRESDDGTSSTFVCTFRPTREGRAGFRVTFRGATFTATAQVPPQLRVAALRAPPPPLTVSCSPDGLLSTNAMIVTVVVRDGLLPRRASDAPPASLLQMSLCGAASGRAPAFVSTGAGAVYTAAVVLEQQGSKSVHRYAGCDVCLAGGPPVRGTTRFIAAPEKEPAAAPHTISVSCSPSPCRVGEEVTVVAVHRNAVLGSLAGAAESGSLRITSVGNVERLTQPAPLPGFVGVQTATFVPFPPDSTGRAGVDVFVSGAADSSVPVARATVEVLPPKPFQANRTGLVLTPARAAAGDVVHVLLTTHDADGAEAPGPEPCFFKLTATGAATNVSAVHRKSRSDGRYVASFEVGSSSGATFAGVALEFVGHKSEARVVVTSAADAGAGRRPPEHMPPRVPPLLVFFSADPVPPDSEVEVLVSLCEVKSSEPIGDPLRRRQRARDPRPLAPPRLEKTSNLTVIEQPSLLPARGVWVAKCRVGSRGSAGLTVTTDGGVSVYASTTVAGDSPASTLSAQVSRIQCVTRTVLDAARIRELAFADVARRRKELRERKEAIAQGWREVEALSPAARETGAVLPTKCTD